MNTRLLVLVFVTLSSNVQADLQIGIQSGDGSDSTISSNGLFAKMQDSQQPTYVIIDYQKSLFSMVDPQRQKAMQATANDFASMGSVATTPVKLDLKKAGNGPSIASYASQKFTLSVDGQHCSTIFGSQAVLKKKGMQPLLDAMTQLQQQSQRMLSGLRGAVDPCTQAGLQMAKYFKVTGAPLRILDKNDQLESQITSINDNKNLPANTYDIPANFERINIKDQMGQSSQSMPQGLGDDMPDMNAIMQQLQESGELTPEMMEQMKKMKEMLKQQIQ